MMQLRHVAVIVLAVCGLAIDSDWSYHGHNCPRRWKEKYPTCGGSSQSPINIIPAYSIGWPVYNPPDFNSFGYDVPIAFSPMTNDGHTVKVAVHGGQTWFNGGGLSGAYTLEQFHFHFGSNSFQGSEHLMNGQSASLEVHFVHYRSDLGSVANALSNPEGIAVFAFMFQASGNVHNYNIDPIVNMLQQVFYNDTSVFVGPFSLLSLGSPDMNTHYRYHGSLTTPPCSESVIWTVFPITNFISESQLAQFRSLLSTRAFETPWMPMADNFRPVQPLNGRPVYFNRY